MLPEVAPSVSVEVSLLPTDLEATVVQEEEKQEVEPEVIRPTMDEDSPSRWTSGLTLRKCGIADNQLEKHCSKIASQLHSSSNETENDSFNGKLTTSINPDVKDIDFDDRILLSSLYASEIYSNLQQRKDISDL